MVWTSLSACFSSADVWSAKPANTATQHIARSFIMNFPSSLYYDHVALALTASILRGPARGSLLQAAANVRCATIHIKLLEPYGKCWLKPLGLSHDQIGGRPVSDIDALHGALPVTHGIRGKI